MKKWEILGIEPTKDKKEIKKAYRSLLSVTNPEDKPEEFMALREAYEAALSWADEEEEVPLDLNFEDGEKSPVILWLERVVDICCDQDKMTDMKYWDEVFSDHVCYDFDYEEEFNNVLIDFLAGNPIIPKEFFFKLSTVISRKIPEDILCCIDGEAAIFKGEYEDAMDSFHSALDVDEDMTWARTGLAEALMKMEQYEDSFDILKSILKENRYDPRALELEDKLIIFLSENYTSKLDEGVITDEEYLKLCDIYIDSDRIGEAIEMLKKRQFEEVRHIALQNLHLASAYLELEDYPKVLDHADLTISHLQPVISLPSDAEETARRTAIVCTGYMLKSLAHENMGDLESSLIVLEKAVSVFPEDSLLIARKAEIHYELKQYEMAIEAASDSLEMDPSFHVAYRIRGNAYYELGMYSEAFYDCQRSIEIFEPELQAHFCIINIMIESGEAAEALEYLDYLNSQVSGTQLAFLRGKALEASNQTEAAIETYTEALEMLKDDSRDLYIPAEVKSSAGLSYRLYCALTKVKRNEEAEAALEAGLKANPLNVDLLGAMAEVYCSKSLRDKSFLVKAQECYQTIVDIEGENSAYIGMCAENLIGLNRFEEAAHLLDVLESSGNEPLITEVLKGSLQMHLNNYDKAMEHYSNAVSMQEVDDVATPYVYRDLSMIYMRLKDYEKADELIIHNCNAFDQARDYSGHMEILRIKGDSNRLYQTADQLIEKFKDRSDNDLAEILEEALGCAIDEGNREMFEKYLSYVKDEEKIHFVRARYCLYNEGFQASYDHLNKIFPLKASSEKEDLPVRIHKLLSMAKVLYGLGRKAEAADFAQEVLKILPKNSHLSGRDYLIYLTQQAETLALLGQFEEAERLAKDAFNHRRCDFCRFCDCLDGWISLAFVYALMGDEEKMNWAVSEGLKITSHDYDLENVYRYLDNNH